MLHHQHRNIFVLRNNRWSIYPYLPLRQKLKHAQKGETDEVSILRKKKKRAWEQECGENLNSVLLPTKNVVKLDSLKTIPLSGIVGDSFFLANLQRCDVI